MGKVLSLALKPIRTFNVENRAHKVISRDKPTPAPQYEYTKKQLDIVKEMYPDLGENILKKDQKLDTRLRDVYLTSSDPEVKEQDSRYNPEKPLPRLTRQYQEFEYGFHEPDRVSEGSCKLRDVLAFLSKHSSDPKKHNAQSIAKEYKLDEKLVEAVLRHYSVYNLYLPKDKENKFERVAITSSNSTKSIEDKQTNN